MRKISFLLVGVMAVSLIGFGIVMTSEAAVRPVRPSLRHFTSCSALARQVRSATNVLSERGGGGENFDSMGMAPSAMVETKTSDYSQTNIQVQGVDEADLVKTDGRYAYHLTKNRLAISRVSPPDQAKLDSLTEFGDTFQARDLYIDGNRLMVIGTIWEPHVYPMPSSARPSQPTSIWNGRTLSVAQIWDVTDRTHPKKERTVEFDGIVSASRLLDGRVYLVMNAASAWNGVYPYRSSVDLMPAYRDSQTGNKFIPLARCTDIRYYELRPSTQYMAIVSLPMKGTGSVEKTVVFGSSETVYASTKNLYVSRQNWQPMPVLKRGIIAPIPSEQTVIEKFSFKDGKTTYQGRGTIPGRLLNQFSMDEFNGDLRVATTKGNEWDQKNPLTNGVYVLSSNLKMRGRLEKLAQGERIYSVRFMGKRGYVVTFKKVDPLFVIDLEKPNAPSVLGALKIPGYSDYLHPMDETHLIGVGKNTEEAAEGDFAWYQGMKLAVFDVTDVRHPRELWKTEIGDRGTDSPALRDHKAFLYAPSKQLLALPIQLAQLSAEQRVTPEREGSAYGETVFQGAYVYRLTLERGFELLGRITHHVTNDAFQSSSGFWFGEGNENIDRIHYVNDSLLTFSSAAIQLHRLTDLQPQNQIRYPVSVQENPAMPLEE